MRFNKVLGVGPMDIKQNVIEGGETRMLEGHNSSMTTSTFYFDETENKVVHGSLEANDQIILGIEVEDFDAIPPQLTFLIKSNSPYYHFTHLLKDLENADDVIFFGHSVNGMDFPYFKSYFMDLSTLPINKLENKHITIITYDEYSAMEIKDNFRRNGIDVRNLFNKVAMNFIMTKGVYEGKESEIAKLEVLKNEIIEGIEGGG